MRIELKGIHRVTRRLADGSLRVHHYAWRGGPKFWSSGGEIAEGSAEYVAALAAATEKARPKPRGGISVPQLVDQFLDHIGRGKLAERTRRDYRKYGLGSVEIQDSQTAAVLIQAPKREP